MESPTKVKVALKVLDAMKEKDGKSVHRFMEESVQSNSFKGISICGSVSEKEQFFTCKKRFFQGLIDNIQRRFPSNDIMSAAEVLNVDLWPEQEEEIMLYGDKEITTVAKCVGLNAAEVLCDFREYKMTKN